MDFQLIIQLGRHSGAAQSLHVLPAWVCVGSLRVLWRPPTNTGKLGFRLIVHSKLPAGVNGSVNACLSLYSSPAMNRRLVQGDCVHQMMPGHAPQQDKRQKMNRII